MIDDFLVQDLHHVIIKGRQNLVGRFNDRDALACNIQVFRDLDTDKTAADYADLL